MKKKAFLIAIGFLIVISLAVSLLGGCGNGYDQKKINQLKEKSDKLEQELLSIKNHLEEMTGNQVNLADLEKWVVTVSLATIYGSGALSIPIVQDLSLPAGMVGWTADYKRGVIFYPYIVTVASLSDDLKSSVPGDARLGGVIRWEEEGSSNFTALDLIGYDPETYLTIFRIPPDSQYLAPSILPEIGDSSTLKNGDIVWKTTMFLDQIIDQTDQGYSISDRMITGFSSALFLSHYTPPLDTEGKERENKKGFFIDAPTRQHDVGTPVFNDRGELVGIVDLYGVAWELDVGHAYYIEDVIKLVKEKFGIDLLNAQ